MTPQWQYRPALQSQTRISATRQTETQITDLPSCAATTNCTLCSLQDQSHRKGSNLQCTTYYLEGDSTGLLYLAQQWKANGTQECCHSGEVLCS